MKKEVPVGSDVNDSPSEPTLDSPERKEKMKHHHHPKHHKHHKHKHHSEKRLPSDLTGHYENHTPCPAKVVGSESTESPQKTYVLSRDDVTNTIRISSSKKRIVNNCGVQVNLRRRTENRYVQVNLSRRHDTPGVQTPEKVSVNGHSIKHGTITGHKVSRGVQTSTTPSTHNIAAKSAPPSETPKASEEVNQEIKKSEILTDSKVFSLHKDLVPNKDNPLVNSKYKHLMHIEQYPNGGALVLHVYQNEISKLSPEQMEEFVKDYFDFVYGESSEGVGHCVMGIVHDAITNLPDFIDYFTENHPEITVKAGVLGKSDIETITMSKYQEQMIKSYKNGTFRCGPLLQISLVGTVHEEVGGFFPEFLNLLESNPFLKVVMPWGIRSAVPKMPRNRSNDGPILWARPGEQTVPTADMPKSPFKRKR